MQQSITVVPSTFLAGKTTPTKLRDWMRKLKSGFSLVVWTMKDGVTVLFMSIQFSFLLADMDTAIILRPVFFRAKICAVGN